VQTGLGAAFGKIPGAKMKPISAGRGSYGAVTKQIITKFQRGQIKSVSNRTLGKMATYYGVESLTGTTPVSGIARGLDQRFRDNRRK
jgi:hypothetical protein